MLQYLLRRLGRLAIRLRHRRPRIRIRLVSNRPVLHAVCKVHRRTQVLFLLLGTPSVVEPGLRRPLHLITEL